MDILYQDNRIAVCLKPPGVLSTDEPGGMPSLLRAALGTDCVRTVHRLDAAVGGVMVFARSRMAASILSEQIREHRFQKEYLAVVHGMLPAEGRMQDFLLRDRCDGLTRVAEAGTPRREGGAALLSCARPYRRQNPRPRCTRDRADASDPRAIFRARPRPPRRPEIRPRRDGRDRPLVVPHRLFPSGNRGVDDVRPRAPRNSAILRF